MNTIKELTQQEKYNTMLKRKNREIKSLKEQLEYLRNNEYLKQVKWERDFNEQVNKDLQERIDKAIEYIKKIIISGKSEHSFNEYAVDFQQTKEGKILLDILKGSDNNEL